MKKLLFSVMLFASTGMLMAQSSVPQLSNPAPNLNFKPLELMRVDTLHGSPDLKDLSKIPQNSLFKDLTALQNAKQMVLSNGLMIAAANNIDRMPIVVLAGNSHMPIYKSGGIYKMPVAGFNKKPGQPTIKVVP